MFTYFYSLKDFDTGTSTDVEGSATPTDLKDPKYTKNNHHRLKEPLIITNGINSIFRRGMTIPMEMLF